VDIEIPPFLGNRILDADYAARFPGASIYPCLAGLTQERGWGMVTADVFLAERPSFQQAVTLSNEFTTFFPQLVSLGVKPGVLISGESPNVARSFYKDLPVRSAPFHHANLFRGSLCRLHENVEGHPWLWPCPDRVLTTDSPWAERRLLGMVAGFKGVWSGPRGWIRNLPTFIRSRWDRIREPSLRLSDLYGMRLDLVRYFGPKASFVLRGSGWEHTVAGKCRFWRKPIRYGNSPSPCEDKLSVLGECRFALALENAIYPGYVTEKILDAFRAGAVPVYLGAPDITDYVPAECFIDYRGFASPELLEDHLATMPENRWTQYRQAARWFMSSPQYQRHLEQNVAMQWLEWLEDAAQ
jgi:hypothetical protein